MKNDCPAHWHWMLEGDGTAFLDFPKLESTSGMSGFIALVVQCLMRSPCKPLKAIQAALLALPCKVSSCYEGGL